MHALATLKNIMASHGDIKKLNSNVTQSGPKILFLIYPTCILKPLINRCVTKSVFFEYSKYLTFNKSNYLKRTNLKKNM